MPMILFFQTVKAIKEYSFADANTYTFSNLTANKTYYFSVFSYNGTGSQINYKINGTFPLTNSFVPGSLAAEPRITQPDLLQSHYG